MIGKNLHRKKSDFLNEALGLWKASAKKLSTEKISIYIKSHQKINLIFQVILSIVCKQSVNAIIIKKISLK